MLQLLIDRGNAPSTSGIGVYSNGLMEALKKYCSDRINVQELGASWTGKSWRPVRRLVYLARVNRLRGNFFSGADIVHFTNYYVPRPRSPISYAVTIYDIDAIILPEAHTRRFSVYFRNVVKKAVERADTIIVNSNAVRSDLVNFFGLHDKKIAVIGIGVSEAFTKLADVYGHYSPQLPTLLFVGALWKKKNIAWVVRTVASGVKSGALPKLKIILAGNHGYGFNEIQNELALAGDIVQYVPSPSLSEVVKLYCSCTAVIFPSLREGFGIPLLEAMYCGKPIVASRIPSNIEVAHDIAHFFSLQNIDEFYHAVNSAITEKNLTALQPTVIQRLKTYSWEHLSSEYSTVYLAT